jgi:hypothetical protein
MLYKHTNELTAPYPMSVYLNKESGTESKRVPLCGGQRLL